MRGEKLTIERRRWVPAPSYLSGGNHAAIDEVLHTSIGGGVEDDFSDINLSKTTRLIESLSPSNARVKLKGRWRMISTLPRERNPFYHLQDHLRSY